MPHRFVFFLFVCCAYVGCCGHLAAQPAIPGEKLRVEAQSGDGIYSILRRYQLLDYGCNLPEFLRLNNLRNNQQLIRGRRYELPIDVTEFDGRTIRSSTGNDNYNRAYSIQLYNEGLTEAGIRPLDFRKDKLLYIPFHLDNCPDDVVEEEDPDILTDIGEQPTREGYLASGLIDPSVPTAPAPEQVTTDGYRTFNIFGPDHAQVPLIDNALAGRVFYIVAGHGGPDPGAVGKRAGNALYEDEYAYDVALRLTRNILQHGGTPYMIVRDDNDGIRDAKFLKGDTDETVWGGARLPRNQKARLFQRSDIINSLYDQNLAKGITDQTMISIHIDSRQSGTRIDLFFYYHEGDLIGAKQAERLHRTIGAKYDQYRPGRGYAGTVKARDLHMLRETKPSGVYIELANIRNSSDQQRILLAANRQLLADWLLLGLMED